MNTPTQASKPNMKLNELTTNISDDINMTVSENNAAEIHSVEEPHKEMAETKLSSSKLYHILNKFNEVGLVRTRKMKDLEIGKTYDLHALKSTETKFGPAIVATLFDGNKIFTVLLPKRFVQAFPYDNIDYVNMRPFLMKYLGGKYHDVEFSASE